MNDSELKPFALKILAGLLGALDRLFEPVNLVWPYALVRDQAHWQRRQLWRSDGLFQFKNPGADPAERKHYARAMSELEKTGLIRAGLREHFGPTDSGLETARRLCRRLQLADTLPGLDFILTLIGGPHEWMDDNSGGYVSESSIAGCDAWPRRLIGECRLPDSAFWVCDALKPLIVNGYIAFDYRPEFELALFWLTSSGKELALSRKKSGASCPSSWLKLSDREQPEPPPAYSQGWQAMERFLQTAPPLDPNRVTHHLSINLDPRGGIETGGTAPPKSKQKQKGRTQ